MNIENIPISTLLPHGPEATLIDRLVSSSASESVAIVDIVDSTPFLNDGTVPNYFGIEYMAQTIAARVGLEAYRQNVTPPMGVLLGTRAFQCSVRGFALGSRLEIRVKPLIVDGGFGSFDCRIDIGDLIAKAVLNTYKPGPEALARIVSVES
jgi:predicted hotdog family 3-hydroxylacyl-ACP dehydratase